MADLLQLIADGCTTRQFYLVLQSSGCDVNARNDRDETPLMFCISNVEDEGKRATMMRLLLQGGADVNAYNKRGQTAIMYACILDQADSVVLILGKEKVDVNRRDFDGNTALMYACSLGNVMAVKTLFKYHTMGEIVLDFSARNREQATALEYALSGHHSQIVSLFTAVRTPNYTEPLNIDKYKTGSNCEKRKVLSIDPVLFKSKNTPDDENVTEDKVNSQNGHRDRKRNENALLNGVPKITVSRATSDDDYMSDGMDVEEFGSLVQAMRECAVEMKQLRNNIENKDHHVNKHHRSKDKRIRKQKTKQRSHKNSFETTTMTVSRVKVETSQRELNSVSGDQEIKESERLSKSSSFTRSLHFNSYTSLKSSEESKDALLHCSNNQLHDPSEPLLSISKMSQLSPRVLCQVTPSTSKTQVIPSKESDGRENEKHVRKNRKKSSFRQGKMQLNPTPCSSSLSDRSSLLLSPSHIILHTSSQNSLSLESRARSDESDNDKNPNSTIFKDPWNFSGESLPQLPKFGPSKSPIHLPPLKETLRVGIKGSQQRAANLKNIDKELWKLLESSPPSKSDD